MKNHEKPNPASATSSSDIQQMAKDAKNKATKNATANANKPDYVVAIGASAGGLDALEKFFANFPSDSGAAFVVIQHLSPDHKSIMDSLLSRYTKMPVKTVTHNMTIEADSVYLIPSGSMMHIEDAQFLLTPKSPRALSLPIDVFFQSLASNFKEKSIGVVLSGTGSDGTRGAGSINEAGGLLIAQDPEGAKFDGMPRSVISTGLVDAILPVEHMAERIYAHVKSHGTSSLSLRNTIANTAAKDSIENAYKSVIELLGQHGGINFADYKPGTVTRRIERRMAVCQMNSLHEYFGLLNEDHNEIMTLRRELLIPVTSFFRDSDSFEALKRQVVDYLLNSKQIDQGVRVWCAGVSTGEEAYSIAMLFLEAFESAKKWPSLKIFATDVEQQNIDTASAGVYPESIMAEITSEQLERFFTRRGNQFVVKNELRQRIVFAKHNLLTDPPFTKMDLVVCRNVLIYFNAEAQQRVLRRLQYALKPNSFLFLGSSESLGNLHADFLSIAPRQKIWKVLKPTPIPLEMENRSHSMWLPSNNYRKTRITPNWESRSRAQSIVQRGYETLLQTFSPPAAILVGPDHELIHSYGDASRYLKIRPGHATLEVTKILPEPLIPIAAALLFKSVRESASTISDIVRVHLDHTDDNQRIPIRLSAWPVLENNTEEEQPQRLTLLVFEEINESNKDSSAIAVDVELETSERMEVLQNELAATRESLQATIEELETSNEELQATNEEMMASNEELQSSNEELQSVNEELNTVNAEYQEKIEILNRVNADLDNLAKVVASGTVFVDEKLNLTRFSPDAQKIFKLRDSDIGRPLSDISHVLDYPDLVLDLQKSLSTGLMHERDVASNDGLHYLVKMLPYRIPSSAESGLVINFIEITSIRRASKLQETLDASFESLAVIDYSGKLVIANQSWLNDKNFAAPYNLTSIPINGNYIDFCRKNLATTPWAEPLYDEISMLIQRKNKEFKLNLSDGRILVLGKCMSEDKNSILLQIIDKNNFTF